MPFLLFIWFDTSVVVEHGDRDDDLVPDTLLLFFLLTNSVVAVHASVLQTIPPPALEPEPDDVWKLMGDSRIESGVIWPSSSS